MTVVQHFWRTVFQLSMTRGSLLHVRRQEKSGEELLSEMQEIMNPRLGDALPQQTVKKPVRARLTV